MVTFELNGRLIQTDADKNLLTFLRKDMGIKSAKDGCSEGACGTCSVLVDGVSRRACTLQVQNLTASALSPSKGFRTTRNRCTLTALPRRVRFSAVSAFPAW